ncbi:MAG: MmcQ/YjbR family DNA-binding protein [Bradyrhizobium guangdongense]
MTIGRFRRIALALPDAVEGSHHGKADFRVGKRVFATLGYPDAKWGMVKLTPEQQTMLVDAEGDVFRPGQERQHNCAARKADPATLRSALTMAWRNVAPKSLLALPDKSKR